MEAPISMRSRLWMWLKYAVSVFRRFSTRYFGICHFFLRYCGIGYPPMSPSRRSSLVANRAFVFFLCERVLSRTPKSSKQKKGSAARVKSSLEQKRISKTKTKQIKQKGEPVFTGFYLIFCHSPQPPLIWEREFILKYLTVTWASLMAKREKKKHFLTL